MARTLQQHIEPGLFSRPEFWAYIGVGETLGREVLVCNPWLIVRIGDRVLIPRVRADAFIARLGQDGNVRVEPPAELSGLPRAAGIA